MSGPHFGRLKRVSFQAAPLLGGPAVSSGRRSASRHPSAFPHLRSVHNRVGNRISRQFCISPRPLVPGALWPERVYPGGHNSLDCLRRCVGQPVASGVVELYEAGALAGSACGFPDNCPSARSYRLVIPGPRRGHSSPGHRPVRFLALRRIGRRNGSLAGESSHVRNCVRRVGKPHPSNRSASTNGLGCRGHALRPHLAQREEPLAEYRTAQEIQQERCRDIIVFPDFGDAGPTLLRPSPFLLHSWNGLVPVLPPSRLTNAAIAQRKA